MHIFPPSVHIASGMETNMHGAWPTLDADTSADSGSTPHNFPLRAHPWRKTMSFIPQLGRPGGSGEMAFFVPNRCKSGMVSAIWRPLLGGLFMQNMIGICDLAASFWMPYDAKHEWYLRSGGLSCRVLSRLCICICPCPGSVLGTWKIIKYKRWMSF